jgi:hypothetical protein
MGRSPAKPFRCNVVSETVNIALRRRNSLAAPFYVHCSERECQWVDTNAPPCPLSLDLFSAEILTRTAARAEARGE